MVVVVVVVDIELRDGRPMDIDFSIRYEVNVDSSC